MPKPGASGPTSSTLRAETSRTRAAPRSVATLTLALSCDRPRDGSVFFRLPALTEPEPLRIGRGAELRQAEGHLTVPDARMSTDHASVALTSSEGWVITDRGSTNGVRRNGELLPRAALADGDVLQLGHSFFVFRLGPAPGVGALVSGDSLLRTASPQFAADLVKLARIATSTLPVLLLGDTGTGKEVTARAVHVRSGRPGPFVAVNCGALSPSLVEAQLFGHVRGAFTGATRDEPGFVRAATHGTLLLDEIGELPLASQAALLRMLQEGEVVPVGSSRPEAVDVRVVSATHRSLDEAMADGRFRPDLYARLAGFVHTLPPLSERREDIGLLVAIFLDRIGAPPDLRLHPEVGRALFNYPFPLNIRELEHAVAAAIALAEDGVVTLEALPTALAGAKVAASRTSRPPSIAPGPALTIEDQKLRDELVSHLAATSGNLTEVGRRMGKARQQIQRWVRRFRLEGE